MDDERREEIRRLRERWSEAKARREAAASEVKGAASWVAPIREAFGRPFFYSGPTHARPENAAKSADTYTGYASHGVVRDLMLPALRTFKDAERELREIRERLLALGEEP